MPCERLEGGHAANLHTAAFDAAMWLELQSVTFDLNVMSLIIRQYTLQNLSILTRMQLKNASENIQSNFSLPLPTSIKVLSAGALQHVSIACKPWNSGHL